MALVLVVLLLVAGLAIDVGHGQFVRRNTQTISDVSALAAGKQLAAVGGALSGPRPAGDSAYQAAHDFAANNGDATDYPNTACNGGNSGTSFYAVWFDHAFTTSPDTCSASSGFTTRVVVNDPPCGMSAQGSIQFAYSAFNCRGVDPNQLLPPDCTANPYNCLEVVITEKVQNYIMGLIGMGTSYTTTFSVVYAQPSTAASGPPPYAAYLYEPSAGCVAGHQCFAQGAAPSRALMSCAGSSNCPTFWTVKHHPLIAGSDGSKLTPTGDFPAVESNGDVVLGDDTTFCDPTGGATCKSNQAIGVAGFALNGTGAAGTATLYCKAYQNGSPGTYQGCSTALGNGANGKLSGNEVGFTSTSYTVTVTQQTNDCGALLLNGDTVPNSLAGGLPSSCYPDTSEPYTIQPGKYSSIVINHGTYVFDTGIYDIYGTAPVNSNSNGVANGIDHGNEDSKNNSGDGDFDLCAKNSSCTLTAGVWIGHGKLNASSSGSSGSGGSACSGGSGGGGGGGGSGTQGGGGDQTNVSGSGVTFLLRSTSGGFVSTNEVQSITLSAPGSGGNTQISNSAPVLIDEENSSFVHLDGQGSSSSNQAAFSGIVYQTPMATAGGVEINSGLSSNGASLAGQVIAYSLALFGHDGTAIDLSNGYGSAIPPITNSGKTENGMIAQAYPLTDAGNGMLAFRLDYGDEWALDAYDSFIIVNGNPAQYFSQGMWATGSGTAGPPPEPNGSNLPSDLHPVYPDGSGVSNYQLAGTQGTYTRSADAITGSDTDYKITLSYPTGGTATFETYGNWTWGHEKDITGNSRAKGTNQATLIYTFPKPSGTSLTLTLGMLDGDHCGDSATYTATLSIPNGQPGGGRPTGGAVYLEQ